jgi:hypothetical protein
MSRWIVRESGFPFSLPGKQVGVVEATDRQHALFVAHRDLGRGEFTVEPEHRVNPALEKVVAKAVKGAERRQRSGRYAQSRPRRKPLTHPDGDGA